MDRKTRREFLKSFISEIIFNLQGIYIKEALQKEIEEELLRETTRQNKEIEGIEESRLITRQFGPKIIQPVQIKPVTMPQEVRTETPQEPLRIDSRIDPLLAQDIKIMECANGNIRIKRNGEFEQTTIFLDEQEVKDLIKKFSEMTKMPISDNIFRATLNNLSITAIVSDKIGSRFFITKI